MPTLIEDWTDQQRARELDERHTRHIAALDRFIADFTAHCERWDRDMTATLDRIRALNNAMPAADIPSVEVGRLPRFPRPLGSC